MSFFPILEAKALPELINLFGKNPAEVGIEPDEAALFLQELFLSAHFPLDAKPQLVKALRSSQPIVRQNAIDELDELECKEALPSIAGLLDDPDESVRDAAQWAVAHLESV